MGKECKSAVPGRIEVGETWIDNVIWSSSFSCQTVRCEIECAQERRSRERRNKEIKKRREIQQVLGLKDGGMRSRKRTPRREGEENARG